jgi:hypothetical protein
MIYTQIAQGDPEPSRRRLLGGPWKPIDDKQRKPDNGGKRRRELPRPEDATSEKPLPPSGRVGSARIGHSLFRTS